MDEHDILNALQASLDPAALAGMARYGINTSRAFGVSLPLLRDAARQIGTSHALAQRLWRMGYRETRLLATLIDDPTAVTPTQMERWASEVDSWDVCDGLCNNLLRETPEAYTKATEWAGRPETFVKRAGFVLMAALAVHDKRADDQRFEDFLKLVAREAADERNFVRKAVNWALRQIGKRNPLLRRRAIALARVLARRASSSARWVGKDALRELARPTTSEIRWSSGVRSAATPEGRVRKR